MAEKDPERKKEYLLQFSRYGELERFMEANIPNLSSAKTKDLWWLCKSYAEVKKYNKLFPCLDQMERNIAQGDRELNLGTDWVNSMLFLVSSDASYYPPLWRAQAYAELKDYDKAISQATRAVALAEASPEQPRSFLFQKIEPQKWVGKLRAQGLLGVLYASSGHPSRAEEVVKAVDKFEMQSFSEHTHSADERKAVKAEQL